MCKTGNTAAPALVRKNVDMMDRRETPGGGNVSKQTEIMHDCDIFLPHMGTNKGLHFRMIDLHIISWHSNGDMDL